MQPCQASDADLWLNGPKFLMLRVSEWLDQPDFIGVLVKDLSSCDIACAQSCCFNVCLNPANPLYRLFARYSTFEKLLTATAWILRFKLYMRVKYLNTELTFRTEPLRAEDYDAAKHAILRTVQCQVFSRCSRLSAFTQENRRRHTKNNAGRRQSSCCVERHSRSFSHTVE